MYEEPDKQAPCFKCKHKAYDSIDNESYCTHTPIPEGLGGLCVVDNWGTCEYWDISPLYRKQ